MAKETKLSVAKMKFLEGSFSEFERSYNQFRKYAMEEVELYSELFEQIEGYYNNVPWKKAFLACQDMKNICMLMQKRELNSETLKNKVISKITEMLEYNMKLFGDGEHPEVYYEDERHLVIMVCSDFLVSFSTVKDKCKYLAILWEILRQIEENPIAKEFYGESARNKLVRRSVQNLYYCGLLKEFLQELTESEEKDYVKQFIYEMLQVYEEIVESEEKTNKGKKEKKESKEKEGLSREQQKRLLLVGMVVGGIVLFAAGAGTMMLVGKSEGNTLKKEYETLQAEYKVVQEENKELKQKEKTLEEEVKALKVQLGEDATQEENTIVLKKECAFRETTSDADLSNLMKMLLPETEVTVLEELDNDWLKVEYQEETGYIRYVVGE